MNKSIINKKVLQTMNIVTQTFYKKNLITSQEKLILTFSGGQDSIFLLFFFYLLKKKLLLDFDLIWCNHFWQTSSFFTMLHVAKCNFCYSSTILFFLPLNKVVSEKVARDWRSKVIQRAVLFYRFSTSAYAHTKSDRIETILFNLIRGTGLTGIATLPVHSTRSFFFYNHFYPIISNGCPILAKQDEASDVQTIRRRLCSSLKGNNWGCFIEYVLLRKTYLLTTESLDPNFWEVCLAKQNMRAKYNNSYLKKSVTISLVKIKRFSIVLLSKKTKYKNPTVLFRRTIKNLNSIAVLGTAIELRYSFCVSNSHYMGMNRNVFSSFKKRKNIEYLLQFLNNPIIKNKFCCFSFLDSPVSYIFLHTNFNQREFTLIKASSNRKLLELLNKHQILIKSAQVKSFIDARVCLPNTPYKVVGYTKDGISNSMQYENVVKNKLNIPSYNPYYNQLKVLNYS